MIYLHFLYSFLFQVKLIFVKYVHFRCSSTISSVKSVLAGICVASNITSPNCLVSYLRSVLPSGHLQYCYKVWHEPCHVYSLNKMLCLFPMTHSLKCTLVLFTFDFSWLVVLDVLLRYHWYKFWCHTNTKIYQIICTWSHKTQDLRLTQHSFWGFKSCRLRYCVWLFSNVLKDCSTFIFSGRNKRNHIFHETAS